jgi:hypothetical protein
MVPLWCQAPLPDEVKPLRVRAAFCAESRLFRGPRRRALSRACRESASCDAAALPSRFNALKVANDRFGFGSPLDAGGAFLPGGVGNFTPARLALDSPMAMACFAERAPCSPRRTCSISSRTYSPACVDGKPARFFLGTAHSPPLPRIASRSSQYGVAP